MDLEMEGGACVRAPAISQSVPLTSVTRVVLVGSTTFGFHDELSGLHATQTGTLGAGAWLGPFLVTGEAGVGESRCEESLCGRDGDDKLRASTAFAASVDAQYAAGVALGSNSFATFLGFRYAYTPVRLPTLVGERQFTTHGAMAVFALGMGGDATGPYLRVERQTLIQMVIPVGVLFAPDAPTNRSAFTAGFGIRFLLPM